MNKVLAIGAAVAALASMSAANAGPLWEFDTAGNSFTNGSWTFATSFTANADMTVTGLGYYADPNTGSVDANPVALYECANLDCTSTGTLLTSVVVDNTYALTGHSDTSPLTLSRYSQATRIRLRVSAWATITLGETRVL